MVRSTFKSWASSYFTDSVILITAGRAGQDGGTFWEVQSAQEVGGAVVGTGPLTITTGDGDMLHYSAVASEPLESASKAPAAEVAASSCLRRAAALAGLGLSLWG